MSPPPTQESRTDVYSLGIILYEFLAGAPPLDLRGVAFDEVLRRLRQDDPPKPSTRLRRLDPATSMEVARQRHSEPRTLARQIRGDLDSIALKALEKDRSRRYGSPPISPPISAATCARKRSKQLRPR
jgi:eukaryotic-like serine/threonine-protein kinase